MASTIQIRVDDDLKNKSDQLFKDLGTDTTSAIRMFLTQAVAYNGFPFEIKLSAWAGNVDIKVLKRFSAWKVFIEFQSKNPFRISPNRVPLLFSEVFFVNLRLKFQRRRISTFVIDIKSRNSHIFHLLNKKYPHKMRIHKIKFFN